MSPAPLSLDSFKCRKTLKVGAKSYEYFSLPDAEKNGLAGLSKLPFSLKVLVENLLRHEDGRSVKAPDIKAVLEWLKTKTSTVEIAYRPARVLMQDFTGVPAVVDLAAMRDAMQSLGGDPAKINPLVPVDLVIDHSVMVDFFGTSGAFEKNVELEYERNKERYEFLRWGAGAFNNFRVVPPGTGICHQVNLEYLAQTVWTKDVGKVTQAFPDTCVGTDSHTTMVNALGVLGWGVGGIEAEAAMLGQPVAMVIPEVIGFGFKGKLREGVTATDLVLTCTQMLRKRGVVEKFVEYYGDGLDNLSVEDRATIANMAPEYGATCGFFPVDGDTLKYLKATGRDPHRVALAEAYCKAQGLWREPGTQPVFTDALELDLDTVEPSMAGPKRPQDRVALINIKPDFAKALPDIVKGANTSQRVKVEGTDYDIGHGDVVIAAITSCTNTSNPSVLVAAGLVARNARQKGLKVKPWVKTSLAPGSQIVTDYLAKANLQDDLDALGFNLAGYGCTTCIGNSGPLPDHIADAIRKADLVAAAVLSGNRNFEGRVNADVKANYLASPPLVVAYAIAGTLNINLTSEPLGTGSRWQARLPEGHLADLGRGGRADPHQRHARDVRQALQERVRRRRALAGDGQGQAVSHLPLELRLHLRAEPALLRGPAADAGADRRCGGRAHPRHVPGQHHHRPHLAGRLDQEGRPGRRLPDRASGAAERFQLLRRAARQSQRHDARHVRQHPHQEHDAGRQGGRQHHPLSLATSRCRSTTRPCATRPRACRWSCSPARSTAPAPAATGRPRARACSASAPSSPSRSSASIAPTWSAWACCRWCSRAACRGATSASLVKKRLASAALPT